VVLGSAYVDVGTWYGITPVVGAGVGVAFHQFTDLQDVSVQPAGGFGFADDKNQRTLPGRSWREWVTPSIRA